MLCCSARKPKPPASPAGPVVKATPGTLFSWLAKPTAEDIFARYDADGNGVLSADEFAKFVEEALPSKADATALMDSIDVDHSGAVSLLELRAFLRCYSPQTDSVRTKTALVVIDVQNDFITGTMANPYDAKRIVPVINGMRDAFDVVVISYDWHPFHHCSFVESANDGEVALAPGAPPIPEGGYARQTVVPLRADADRPEHNQVLFPRHCAQGSWGAQCPENLRVLPSDGSILKGSKPNIDSYSAFYDNCQANDTGLCEMLASQGVTHVYCCGLVLDICVKASALHGAEAGFVTAIIEDASRPLNQKAVPGVKAELSEAGVRLVSSRTAAAEARAARGRSVPLKHYLLQVGTMKNSPKVHRASSISSHGALPVQAGV